MPLDQATAYILLAEDDPANQFVFRKVLERAGYQILIVEDGKKALEACRVQRPDLVLMDLMMPVMDGLEAASRMSRDPRLDGVPIIALTARTMPGDKERSRLAGCNDHISKPVSIDGLLSVVRNWLSRDPATWMPERVALRSSSEEAA
jgi:CheY-like chemotaxis protein